MARDDEEFTVIFNDLYPSLCRFLECTLGGGGRAVAQDIAQESFLRLYRAGPCSIPCDEVRFWLYRVARNLALNELSKRQTRSRLLGKVIEMFSHRELNPEEMLEQTEHQRIVLELLKRLPEHQRAALLLREQEEMSYQQIARVLEVSESKVKVDIFRARSTLRAHWNERQKAFARTAG